MVEGLKKVLVIGSGPIIIGQAAEFDYAGTQACRALKEEGLEVVLINSNPATIATDEDIADRVYVEPISLDYVTEVIEKNGPTALGHPRRSGRPQHGCPVGQCRRSRKYNVQLSVRACRLSKKRKTVNYSKGHGTISTSRYRKVISLKTFPRPLNCR